VNGGNQGIRGDRSQTAPNVPSPATGLGAALSVLGLAVGASMDQVSAAYKNLAAQNHPDKVAHMAVEFRELAERKDAGA
jgi:preprotein translocase subunit Sec63